MERSEPLQEREDARVVAAHRGHEVRDARSARVGCELAREDRPDTTALVLVRDRECDLRSRAGADESRDPDGLGVAVHVADEDVVVAIDACEVRELELREAWLRAAEAAFARALAETREQRRHGLGVAVLQRSDGEPSDVA